MQSLFNVYKNWTFIFKIGLPNYPSGSGAAFPIQDPGFKSAGWIKVISVFPPVEVD